MIKLFSQIYNFLHCSLINIEINNLNKIYLELFEIENEDDEVNLVKNALKEQVNQKANNEMI